eukprot:TRINITY_DN419_c0_g2_i1.p1 TRINITY_DN419_c0_g2~~TRINITY_DN419_c0_g2_i1.p1  ORF type:complete len:374 (+),score=94.02 TRINITY_DN419_c0_g2_i1:154-1122(+)
MIKTNNDEQSAKQTKTKKTILFDELVSDEENEIQTEDAPSEPNIDENEFGTSSINCRFYENELPDVEQLVMVKITKVNEIGGFGQLLEYDNLEGFVPLADLSRTRIRSVAKHIKQGQIKVLQVVRVDKQRGYVDLSKRDITQEDIDQCSRKFNRCKMIHNTLKRLSETRHRKLPELYEKIVWPLDRKYNTAYRAFQIIAEGDTKILDELEIEEELKSELKNMISKRLEVHPVKIVAEISVTCYSEEGIDHIKKSLKAGIADNVKIQHRASPLYWVFTVTADEDRGRELVLKSIELIKEELEKGKGKLAITEQPHVATLVSEE